MLLRRSLQIILSTLLTFMITFICAVYTNIGAATLCKIINYVYHDTVKLSLSSGSIATTLRFNTIDIKNISIKNSILKVDLLPLFHKTLSISQVSIEQITLPDIITHPLAQLNGSIILTTNHIESFATYHNAYLGIDHELSLSGPLDNYIIQSNMRAGTITSSLQGYGSKNGITLQSAPEDYIQARLDINWQDTLHWSASAKSTAQQNKNDF